MNGFVWPKSLSFFTRGSHFFVRFCSFHHDNQILTMKATMRRLNTASPTASVRGNAANGSIISWGLPLAQLPAMSAKACGWRLLLHLYSIKHSGS